jgi:hypothetical protein
MGILSVKSKIVGKPSVTAGHCTYLHTCEMFSNVILKMPRVNYAMLANARAGFHSGV